MDLWPGVGCKILVKGLYQDYDYTGMVQEVQVTPVYYIYIGQTWDCDNHRLHI